MSKLAKWELILEMNKKVPLRSCVVTREKLEKKQLLRIVRNKENEVSIDLTGKLNGRGAYIKKDLEVLNKAIKSKALERHLECPIKEDLYEEIRRIIETGE